jgi:hypothetical protein
MVMKPEKPRMAKCVPFLARQMAKWFYDTSTSATTGAAPLWFFCWRGSDCTRCWLLGDTVDTRIYVVRAVGA